LFAKEAFVNVPKGIPVIDATRLVREQWAQLSEAQKKPYQDIQIADKLRY
jgi:hypothetical protein